MLSLSLLARCGQGGFNLPLLHVIRQLKNILPIIRSSHPPTCCWTDSSGELLNSVAKVQSTLDFCEKLSQCSESVFAACLSYTHCRVCCFSRIVETVGVNWTCLYIDTPKGAETFTMDSGRSHGKGAGNEHTKRAFTLQPWCHRKTTHRHTRAVLV